MKHFEPNPPLPEIPLSPSWKEPRQVDVRYAPISDMGDDSRRNHVLVGWLTHDIKDNDFEIFAMQVLGKLLLSGPNAPMYTALLESELGLDYAAGTGYAPHSRQAPFGIGLKGVTNENIERVERVILETLTKSCTEGFDRKLIDATIHMIELDEQHVTSKFGLSASMGTNPEWIHGSNPTNSFRLGEMIERLKQELDNGKFFEGLVQKHLLSNTHRLTIVMRPDDNVLKQQNEKEAEKLKKIQSELTQEDIDRINKEAKILAEKQGVSGDVSCLPSLTIADIPKQQWSEGELHRHYSDNGARHFRSPQPTNGLTYLRGSVSLDNLPDELIPYVPLYCSILGELSAGDTNYKELSWQLENTTGGFSASPTLVLDPNDSTKYEQVFGFSINCLNRNVDASFELLAKILFSSDFTDQNRLRNLISERYAPLEDDLVDSGHSYARSHSQSYFSRAHAIKDQWGGIPQLELLDELSQREDLGEVVQALQAINSHISDSRSYSSHIIAEPSALDYSSAKMVKLLQYEPRQDPVAKERFRLDADWKPPTEIKQVALPLHANVNFVAQSFQGVTDPRSKDAACLDLLCKIMSLAYLHNRIREIGGAYGAGASSGGGVLSFHSYRDPESTKTTDVYNGALGWLRESDSLSAENISRAKITAFAAADQPKAPYTRCLTEWKTGITREMKQEYRDHIFSIDKADLIRTAEQYFQNQGKSVNVVLGPTTDTT
eukprot:TRINITY_DN4631_c0_g1_i1.p1 TRINITY_DN4631_c0_g1~~TRINITY_DN4631_c0_g1_i1.p1  ORF type:complete len:720 (+),score=89.46 TRINITY_DN4631_c0_g1_i1:130-2289(+)